MGSPLVVVARRPGGSTVVGVWTPPHVGPPGNMFSEAVSWARRELGQTVTVLALVPADGNLWAVDVR